MSTIPVFSLICLLQSNAILWAIVLNKQIQYNELADIGSFVGGLFSGVSAILMYFTLKAEINSNKEIKEDLKLARLKEEMRVNSLRVDNTQKWLRDQVDSFTYMESSGYYALAMFLRQSSRMDPPKDSDIYSLYKNPKMRELDLILVLIRKLLDDTLALEITAEDQRNYADTIRIIIHKYLIDSFLSQDSLSNIRCPLCNMKYHGAIPCVLYETMIDLYRKLEESKLSTTLSRVMYEMTIEKIE